MCSALRSCSSCGAYRVIRAESSFLGRSEKIHEKVEWENIEKFIEERVDVDFSRGLCPDRMKKLCGDLGR